MLVPATCTALDRDRDSYQYKDDPGVAVFLLDSLWSINFGVYSARIENQAQIYEYLGSIKDPTYKNVTCGIDQSQAWRVAGESSQKGRERESSYVNTDIRYIV